MRHFQLPSADPLFQQESLQLLTDMEMGYEPALVPELRDYVAAQAPFIVKEASEYRSNAANWPVLLAAGQQAFVEIWRECQANQKKPDWTVFSDVRQAILTKATEQLASHTTPENLMSWARDAGEEEATATAFAIYHQRKSADYEQDMAEERARFTAKVPADEEEAAGVLEDLAEVAKYTTEIPATVLSWAWAYIRKYKEALSKAHSPEWADIYADNFGLLDEEAAAERDAYQLLSERHPNPKTSAPEPAPAPGANPYPMEAWVNRAVYNEAYAVRLDRGPEYAAAYAKEVGLGEYDTAEAYATAYMKMRRAGKSELYANYYASEVSSDISPKYAALEAEIYEQALADGMADGWARQYADRLSTNLIEYAETDEDKAHYTQEAAEYIAKKQRDAQAARDARENRAE